MQHDENCMKRRFKTRQLAGYCTTCTPNLVQVNLLLSTLHQGHKARHIHFQQYLGGWRCIARAVVQAQSSFYTSERSTESTPFFGPMERPLGIEAAAQCSRNLCKIQLSSAVGIAGIPENRTKIFFSLGRCAMEVLQRAIWATIV